MYRQASARRAELYNLPVFRVCVQEKKADRSGHPCFRTSNRECGQPSSFLLVAGARYVVEKKIPGRVIDFRCLEDVCRVTAKEPAILVAAA